MYFNFYNYVYLYYLVIYLCIIVFLGIHLVLLILIKGLDILGSFNLVLDKLVFGFFLPYYGPGRGGTYDISLWDLFYLSVFGYLILLTGLI